MKYINWGIIYGEEPENSLLSEAFEGLDGVKVVAVMHKEADVAKEIAFRLGAESYYTDVQELIESPSVNAVYVAASIEARPTFAIMAMQLGKPVVVEMPIAESYEDAIRINRISEQTGVPCFAMCYYRYLPVLSAIKDALKDNKIGNVLSTNIQCLSPLSSYSYNDLLKRFATQSLDILQELFGVIVRAKGYTMPKKVNGQLSINACYMFENGMVGNASWGASDEVEQEKNIITISGDKGMLSFSTSLTGVITFSSSNGNTPIYIKEVSNVYAPAISNIVAHLQSVLPCTSTSVSATPVVWAIDKLLDNF